MLIIETRALTKEFGDVVKVEVLRGINLRISQSEFLAIMGPSGSGKSTLLHLIAGMEPPTTGDVLFEGTDLAELNDDQLTLLRRRRIGFVFQSFNLLPTLTALENVAAPLLLDGISSSLARQKAKELLQQVSMGHRETHFPSQLSGGEQQRVAIARALVIDPAVLLADEPTGNLDSVAGEQIATLLRKLVGDKQQTIVMVTHDPHLAAKTDRIVLMRDGLVESDDRVDHVSKNTSIPDSQVESLKSEPGNEGPSS